MFAGTAFAKLLHALRAPVLARSPALRALIVLLLIAIVMTAALLYSLTSRMNSDSAAERLRMVSSAVSREQRALAETARDYARWNDAVDHVYGVPDRAWLDTNFGGTFWIYIVGRDGRTYYSTAPRGQRYPLELRTAVPKLLPALARLPGHGAVGDPRMLLTTATVADGRPLLISVAAIQPFDERKAVPAEELRYAVFIEPITAPLLGRWRQAFGLGTLEWSKGAAASAAVAFPLKNAEGQVLGHLLWTARSPGTDAIRQLAWQIILSLIALAAIGGWLIRSVLATDRALALKSELVAQSLAERERAFEEADTARATAERALAAAAEASRRLQETIQDDAEEQAQHSQKLRAMSREVAERLQLGIGSLVRQLVASADELDRSALATLASVETQRRDAELARDRSKASAAALELIERNLRELDQATRHIDDQAGKMEQAMRLTAAESGAATAANGDLLDQIDSIGSAARLIQDIATQSHLLALNATIEAARAGEAGRGFAVVASEVKGLASQTHRTTQDIHACVEGVGAAARATASLVEKVHGLLQNLNVTITSTATAVVQQRSTTAAIADARQLVGDHAGSTHMAIDSIVDSLSAVLHNVDGTRSVGARVRDHAEALDQELVRMMEQLRAA